MSKQTATPQPQYRPLSKIDILQFPIIGRVLRHRYGRLAMQSILTMIAVALMIDGFTGPQSATRNLATVAPWVHYRGLVVVVLLLAGNLFCMGCPFTVPRTLAKRLAIRGRRFPQLLRNKWIAIISLFMLFFLYEYLDLWASPLLTAWVIVLYFVASFIMEAVFTESAFCKYMCPLGSFNFVYSTLSPAQIAVKSPDICATCVGKECVNGSYAPQTAIRLDEIPIIDGDTTRTVEVKHSPQGTLGCGTLLFAPQIRTNMDCTMCLDCVRACPHDNVSLFARQVGRELVQPDAWARRWDMSLLVVMLAFMGLSNAFGMVPPYYQLQESLATQFGITDEWVVLLLIFGLLSIVLPVVSVLLASFVGRRLTGMSKRDSLRDTLAAFAPAFVPLGFGIWFAHYIFHFLIAPALIIPVIQEFFGGVGDWQTWSFGVSENVIGFLQMFALLTGFTGSLWLANRIAIRLYRRKMLLGFLPWAILLLLMMLAAWQLFMLPMEMRGAAEMFGSLPILIGEGML